MALYIGKKKIKIHTGGYSYKVESPTSVSNPIVNEVILLSSDGYTLKDSKGLYLTFKKEGE